jgi:hypothetical protein
MTIKINSGLIRIASGGTSAAANEDQLAENRFQGEDGRNDLGVGWDPYHVWRTRVKEARSSPGTIAGIDPARIDSNRKKRRRD